MSLQKIPPALREDLTANKFSKGVLRDPDIKLMELL